MMDSASPYHPSSDNAQTTGAASSSSTTFDPFAVTPAFARTPSSSQHATTTTKDAAPASASRRPANTRLSVPALGDSSLMGELPTTDPLSIMLQKHLPPHIRPVRDLSGAWHAPAASAPSTELPDPFSFSDAYHPQQQRQQQGYAARAGISEEAVQQAAATNAWRKIAMLARSHIETYGSREKDQLYQAQNQLVQMAVDEAEDEGVEEGVAEVLQWWSVRLYSLARLKLYSMLRTELAALWQVLSTAPATPISAGEGSEGQGTMLADTLLIPFTLRVLRATEPKYRGDLRTTVEQYTLLIQLCKQQMKAFKVEGGSDGVKMWKGRAIRLGLMLAFTLAEGKDYAGALDVVSPLVERALTGRKGEVKEEEEGVAARVQLVLVASRLWVQAGDLIAAETLLDRAQTLLSSSSSTSSPLQTTLDRQLTHSKALLSAIAGDFSTAQNHLSLPSCASSPSTTTPETIASTLNLAIIHFYNAQLDSSISTLESVLDTEPALIANADAVIFNAATLYELAQGGEREVVERKRGLLARVAKWAGEPGCSSSSFKL